MQPRFTAHYCPSSLIRCQSETHRSSLMHSEAKDRCIPGAACTTFQALLIALPLICMSQARSAAEFARSQTEVLQHMV